MQKTKPFIEKDHNIQQSCQAKRKKEKSAQVKDYDQICSKYSLSGSFVSFLA